MNSIRIYFDHAATTPVRGEVADAMRDAADQCNFNPSSLHFEGRRARAALDAARDRVAAAIGSHHDEIVFTSGGTESDNLALLGTTRATPRPAHVAASAVEHHAVLAALERLREDGFDTSFVPVDREGRVDPVEFERSLRPDTVLASIMYANNEVGAIQPIAELSEIARRRGALFHTDAVATPCWLPIDVRALGVDLLSISAHKFYGPKGVGLLYVRRGVPLVPLAVGGGQESGRRSGTENLAGIVGMARALELAVAERAKAATDVATLRDRLEAGIRSQIAAVSVNAGGASRLANSCNLSFAGVDPAALIIALDLAGVSASAGSACTSGTLQPSHVLTAMAGQGDGLASGVRFSLGSATTPAEVDRVVHILPAIVGDLRALGSPVAHAGGLGRLETNRARLEAGA
ncbi:MAG: cysteine desulfurase family protein [Candidatus Cybelea sp.]